MENFIVKKGKQGLSRVDLIVITILLIGVILFVRFTFLSVFVPEIGAGNMRQYAGWRYTKPENWILSNDAIIKTPQSTFEIKMLLDSYNVYVQNLQQYLGRDCYYGFEVYRNGILIDKLEVPPEYKGYTFGNPPPYLRDTIYRSYLDDGTILNYRGIPDDKSGIEVTFAETRGNYDNCYVINAIRLILPKNLINVKIQTPKSNYLVGENVRLDVIIINNYNLNLIGNMKILYEVPTILGTMRKEDSQFVTIYPGENKYNYTLLSHIVTEKLNITPSFEIYYETKDFSGINIYFPEEGRTLPYNYKDKFLYGEERENPAEISITLEPIYINQTLDCNIKECPSGYTCQTDGTCIKTEIVGCRTKGCPDGFECNENTNICEQIGIISKWLIIAVVIGVLIVIIALIILLVWLRRRK